MKKAKSNIIKKVIICFAFFAIMSLSFQNVFADFFNDAYEWGLKKDSDDAYDMRNAMSEITDDIGKYIEVVGTAVIFIATITLGIRYIFASAEGKTAAKESAINLLVACILFFGWNSIAGLLYSGTDFILYKDGSFDNAVATIVSVFKLFAEGAALIGVLYVGIKYLLAGADGKAELKKKAFPFIVGIILTFCALEVMKLISDMVVSSVK